MKELIALFEKSIEDDVLVGGEKKEIKALLKSNSFNKSELALLRSKVFDIANAHKDKLSIDNLLVWLETANKLLLVGSDSGVEESKAFFSPGEQCRNAIIQQLKLASKSIDICVFTISDNFIAKEIIHAHERGIPTRVITDNDKCFDKGSDIEELTNRGVDVKIDQTKSHMHHKYCVIDGDTLISGSYNWTRSAATSNQENIVVSKEPKLVKSFLTEFNKLWSAFVDHN